MCDAFFLFFGIAAGRISKLSLKCPEKIRIVVESAQKTGIHDRSTVSQHITGKKQSFFHNILIQRQTGKFFEFSAEIIFTDIKFIGKKVQRQIFRKIIVDKCDELVDLRAWSDVICKTRSKILLEKSLHILEKYICQIDLDAFIRFTGRKICMMGI